ncbi:MAG TPA: efflux transporter outer membrane subunit [Telluria sp.]|nr:efflux transporter outer membrane subunit [Telluria sp.]
MKRHLLGAAVVLALAGCAHVPADRHAAAAADPARAHLAADIKLAREGWPAAQWWRQYGDAQLDILLEKALKDGPSLGTAAARIASAQSLLASEQADAGPEIGLNAGANRQRYSANGLFPEPIGGNWFTSESLQLQTRYEIDWWGKQKAQVAAIAGEVAARRADYALAEQALAGDLAQAYFAYQAARARAAKLRDLEQVQEAQLADRERRIGAGLSIAGEAQNVRLQLADTRKQRAHLEALALREREALRALTGSNADDLPSLEPRPLPAPEAGLPSSLGIELLARRADLQAARWRVETTLSRIEVARAAYYPSISLSAAAGLDSISLSKLLNWGSRTLLGGASLAVPLFDTQRLDAHLDAVRNERNEVVADYNQRVVNAVRTVAQAAVDVNDADGQLARQREAADAAAALLRGAEAKLKQGLVDRAFELNARTAVLRQDDALLALRAQRLAADVALVRALGGGYRSDVAALASTNPTK